MGLLSKAALISSTLDLDPTIRGALIEYHRKNPSFQGILLEPPEKAGSGFFDEVSAMIRTFAVILSLPSYRCLILLPQQQDRELICHRLIKTLNTAAALSFEADDLQSALTLIEPYL